jgi:DNA-binding IscR family transcriptional regulator
VWKYLISHPKTPVQAKTIAKEWIVSKNKIARVLNRFVENEIVDLVRMGSKKFYKVKE